MRARSPQTRESTYFERKDDNVKTLLAVGATAVICAGGAHAYDRAVTPAQISSLQTRVTALERFDKNCLHRVHLTENADGVMVWGIGAPSTHAGAFYAIPDTSRPPIYCLTG
jgi:hypothetical protein